uniref:Peptidase S1 domain-containing protein n=1 Tax=Corethron hystrix TaxID=216773 RepID=A0A7S1FVH2_9STRA|mmetsp:Transcript_34155/g.78866  ORF Transcript_34155/g.78866 Transcript_34155/m.78866 type:complete len:317 (+) Transcript_34155:112-1062(+)
MKLRFGPNFLLVCQALLDFATGNRADEVNTASLVINGKVAPLERYPYMVEFWPDPGCGGSLIHPEVVISAGHCFNIEGLKNPTDVDIGRHTLEQKIDGDTYETIKISDILVHPDYPQNPDVALIKLKEESIMYPVELSNDPNDISQGTVVTTVGWGCYKQNNQARCLEISEKLRYAELEMNTQSFCRNEFGPDFNKDVEMCARDPTEQRSDCNGDSGGPIIKRGNNYSKDVQVGLVSWGPEDCLSGPSVYAKVQGTIYQWVKQTMKKEWGLTLGDRPPTAPIVPTTEPPTKPPSPPTDSPIALPCFNLKAKKVSYF